MGKMNNNFKNKFNKYNPSTFKKGNIHKPNHSKNNKNSKNPNFQPVNPQLLSQAERKEFAIKAGYKKLLRKEQRKGGFNENTVSKTEEKVQLNEAPLSTTSNWTVTVNKDNNNKDLHDKPFLNKDKGKGKTGKPSALKKAQDEYQRKKNNEKERKVELNRIRKEKELAGKSRKQQRLEKYKILNQKTPRGQPVMKGRVQLLLDKIQSSL